MAAFMKKVTTVIFLSISMPMTAMSETVVCSKFDYFNARSLNHFRDHSGLNLKDEEISDWLPGDTITKEASKIVIAVPKYAINESFGCIDKAEHIAPGVKAAISKSSAEVGTSPPEYDKIVVGEHSANSPFGPITMKISYVRTSSLVVQVIITDEAEPVRSIDAIERYFDLPLGYCEQNENCGIEIGEH